jgi:hypothetical protein
VDTARVSVGFETPEAGFDDARQRSRAQLDSERTGVDSRQFEEIVDEPSEILDLLSDCGEVMLGRSQPIFDRLEHRLDRGERRTEVVTCPGHQLPACVEETLEVASHLVEGRGKLGEFGGAYPGGTCTEVAGRERSSRLSEVGHRLADRARQNKRSGESRSGSRPRDEQDR